MTLHLSNYARKTKSVTVIEEDAKNLGPSYNDVSPDVTDEQNGTLQILNSFRMQPTVPLVPFVVPVD